MLSKRTIFEEIRGIYNIPAGVSEHQFEWAQSGIRTQLISRSDKTFCNDFMFERSEGCGSHLHLLNFASPGWTSSFAVAEHVVRTLAAS